MSVIHIFIFLSVKKNESDNNQRHDDVIKGVQWSLGDIIYYATMCENIDGP